MDDREQTLLVEIKRLERELSTKISALDTHRYSMSKSVDGERTGIPDFSTEPDPATRLQGLHLLMKAIGEKSCGGNAVEDVWAERRG